LLTIINSGEKTSPDRKHVADTAVIFNLIRVIIIWLHHILSPIFHFKAQSSKILSKPLHLAYKQA